MIDRLLGFWQMTRVPGTPILSSWYTEYYSQEDRLKALARKMGMDDQWKLLLLEKINELTDKVNELEERVKEIEDGR